MSKVGFKMSYEAESQQNEANPLLTAADINIDDLIQRRGLIKALEVIQEYLSPKYPFVQGEQRDEKYMAKLRRIRERYFEPI